jgi:hypothetical protein
VEKPSVSPGDWIRIGNIDAVVCLIYKDGPYDIEIVFLDKGQAVNKDAKWDNGKWSLDTADYGGYAENYPRLSQFVSILRRGRQDYS